MNIRGRSCRSHVSRETIWFHPQFIHSEKPVENKGIPDFKHNDLCIMTELSTNRKTIGKSRNLKKPVKKMWMKSHCRGIEAKFIICAVSFVPQNQISVAGNQETEETAC